MTLQSEGRSGKTGAAFNFTVPSDRLIVNMGQ